MSRRKKSITEMEAEKSKLELKVSDANQEIRKLNKKISEEKRKARNARIYYDCQNYRQYGKSLGKCSAHYVR